MEYANKAMEWTQEAHRKSAKSAGKPYSCAEGRNL
jgi:hypothetical protein